jgi:hypothetical protein
MKKYLCILAIVTLAGCGNQASEESSNELLMKAYRGSGKTTIPSYQQIVQEEKMQDANKCGKAPTDEQMKRGIDPCSADKAN